MDRTDEDRAEARAALAASIAAAEAEDDAIGALEAAGIIPPVPEELTHEEGIGWRIGYYAALRAQGALA